MVLAAPVEELAYRGVMVEIQYFPVLPRLGVEVAEVMLQVAAELVGLAAAVQELVLLAQQIRVIAAHPQSHLKRVRGAAAQAQQEPDTVVGIVELVVLVVQELPHPSLDHL